MSYLERFYKQVTERTLENKNAFKVLFDQQLYGVCIGLLRQELDTLIRLVYINEQEDSNIKNEILKNRLSKGFGD